MNAEDFMGIHSSSTFISFTVVKFWFSRALRNLLVLGCDFVGKVNIENLQVPKWLEKEASLRSSISDPECGNLCAPLSRSALVVDRTWN